MTSKVKATIADLYRLSSDQKAELVNGEIVLMSPTGGDPGYAADEIFVALREYAKQTKSGRAIGDNKGFRVDLPERETFSPDAAFYIGPDPGMKFYQGAPIFAVEVRSENDYGQKAEADLAKKRADYFAAGTLVVWDVDLISQEVIRVYRNTEPDKPAIYRKGEIAEAVPALPGWEFPVNNLFSR